MTTLLKYTRYFSNYFLGEILVVFITIFCINNYVGNSKEYIHADGQGYYEYLPSIFIYKDFIRKNYETNDTRYDRINKYDFYYLHNNKKINKYPIGTSVLQLPFFLYGHFVTQYSDEEVNGYSIHYQKSIFFAAIFYLFLFLIFFRKLLILFKINIVIILFVQTLICIGTNTIYFVNSDASYSHIYSLFSLTAFLYYTKHFSETLNHKSYYASILFLSLTILIRQINVLAILFIPFITNDKLFYAINYLKSNFRILIAGALVVAIVVSIQLIAWYLQAGNWLIYSYKNESFNFKEPQLLNILFSFKKGLFIYTPVVLLALTAVLHYVLRKEYYILVAWLIPFFIIVYVLSSWWAWHYGCSFGQRAFIDFYGFIFIPFAVLLNRVKLHLKILLLAPAVICIPINLVQAYQYKNYILHWDCMDYEKYKKVFLQTNNEYCGILWKKTLPDTSNFTILYKGKIPDNVTSPNNYNEILTLNLNSISTLNFNAIYLQFENIYNDNDKSRVDLTIKNTKNDSILYNHNIPLIHFAGQKFNTKQQGEYVFAIPATIDTLMLRSSIIHIVTKADDHFTCLNNGIIQLISIK